LFSILIPRVDYALLKRGRRFRKYKVFFFILDKSLIRLGKIKLIRKTEQNYKLSIVSNAKYRFKLLRRLKHAYKLRFKHLFVLLRVCKCRLQISGFK
jgi:hypothetical protein